MEDAELPAKGKGIASGQPERQTLLTAEKVPGAGASTGLTLWASIFEKPTGQ
jgi:hypothetical protein